MQTVKRSTPVRPGEMVGPGVMPGKHREAGDALASSSLGPASTNARNCARFETTGLVTVGLVELVESARREGECRSCLALVDQVVRKGLIIGHTTSPALGSGSQIRPRAACHFAPISAQTADNQGHDPRARHSHAAPAFNTAFYATVAVIVPVLFLALAVQSSTFEDLMKTYATTVLARRRDLARQGKVSPDAPAADRFLATAGGLFATVVLCYVLLGEILAVVALYNQRASSGIGFLVVCSTIFSSLPLPSGPSRSSSGTRSSWLGEVLR
jgi:hypothetical protein